MTGLRFFAAFYVVSTHIVIGRSNPGGLVDLGFLGGRVAELGYLGVTFFFVLSGFVLTWSAADAPVGAWNFYRRRFARVYPLHCVTTIVAGIGLVATGKAVALGAWPLCLLLLQAWVPEQTTYLALNPVSWSLACEAFFYLLTPMLIGWAVRRSTRTCVAAAGGMIVFMAVVAFLVAAFAPDQDWDVWFSPWFSLGTFTAGMGAALAIVRGGLRWPSPRTAGAIVAATLAALVLLSWSGALERTTATVLSLPSIVLLVGATAVKDARGVGGWLTHPWLVRLGTWSFALYLIQILAFNVLTKLLDVPRGWLLGLAAVLVSVSLSGVIYQWFERPMERWLRPRVGDRRNATTDTSMDQAPPELSSRTRRDEAQDSPRTAG